MPFIHRKHPPATHGEPGHEAASCSTQADISTALFDEVSSAHTPHAPGSMQQESEPEGPACRICFDSGSSVSPLISPCACRGSSEFVHVHCLRRWQSSVMSGKIGNKGHERAFRCGVCLVPFSLRPLQPALWHQNLAYVRAGLGVLCMLCMAFGTAGFPWPQVALVVLLLSKSRLHHVLLISLLSVLALLLALYMWGLRLVVNVDPGRGVSMGLIRHGAPVEGLKAGVLLVASRQLNSTVFRESVILIYEHTPGGATKGVILNQPLQGRAGASLAAAAGATAAAAAAGDEVYAAGMNGTAGVASATGGGPSGSGLLLQHMAGGPVGMPLLNPGSAHHEITLLHDVPGVPGSRGVLPAPGTAAAAAAAATGGGDRQQAALAGAAAPAAAWVVDGAGGASSPGSRLYQGGSLTDVLAAAAAASQAADVDLIGAASMGDHQQGQQQQQQQQHTVFVFHGLCGWASGQLEGELRSGCWALATATPRDVAAAVADPGHLWQELVDSDRLSWP